MKKMLLSFAVVSAITQTAFAQTKVITGTVKDKDGEAISGAVITVKGTDISALSDDDGNYSISAPNDANTLIFSSFGNEKQEVRIKGNTVNFTFDSGATETDEVTVYGTKLDARSYVGAISTVTAKEISKRPVTSVAAALDGAAPGVLVTSGGGQPGSNPDIMVRGMGSLSASSAPLIVLDGAPYSGGLNTINPADIKDLVILKDATTKAVYGARAANGVILITTKRGEKSERPRINFDASVGALTRFIPAYKTLGVKDYYETAWNGYVDQATTTISSADFVDFLGGYNAYNVTNDKLMLDGKVNPEASLLWTDNWEKELKRVGVRQNYNLSVSNGDAKSDYYFSLGYTRDQGIVKNSDYSRITALLNVNSRINSWLKTGFKIQTAYEDQLFHLGSGTAYSNPFFGAMQMGAIYPVYRYDANGNRMYQADGTPVYDFGYNTTNTAHGNTELRPFGLNTNTVAALTYNKPNTLALNGNGVGYLEAKIYRDLTAKTQFSVNYYSGDELNYYNSEYGDAANVLGRSIRQSTTNINYTFNQFLTWRPQAENLNQNDSSQHTFGLTVGHEAYNWKNSFTQMRRTGFFAPGFTEGAAAAVGEGSTSQIDRLRIETYFAQAEYSFKKKYFLNASFSRNGSSRFSPSARWGNFGAAGAGWMISDESFMDGLKDKLNMLKLRFSWGVTGNDAINGYYSWLDRFAANPNAGNPGLIFANYGNDKLKWEGQVEMDLGIDLATKQNRLTASLDFYNKGSNNLLYIQPLAPSVGTSGYYANVGSMRNRGVELQVSYDWVRSKKFEWNTRVNLAHNQNAITKMQGDDTLIGGIDILTKGLAVGTYYTYEYAGVSSNGLSQWYKKDGSITTDYNSLTTEDRKIFQSAFRDLEGSVANQIGYRGFDLSFTFTFGLGGKNYDGMYASLMSGGAEARGNAIHADMLNAWTKAGDENNENVVPKFSYGSAGTNAASASSRFLVSNSFLKLRNINLGYNLSPKVLNNSSFKSVRLYFAMDNVLNFTARKGMDVQSSFFGANSFTYFPYRTYVVGVNVGL
ncbi:Ferric enterobactin receptor precursor [compost metagenome]